MIEIYNEKENFQTDPNIPEVNKVIDDDMNQLRNAVLKSAYYDETNNILKAQNGTELDPKITSYEDFKNKIDNFLKFEDMQKSVMIASNGQAGVDMGEYHQPNGYELLGIVAMSNGVGDAWQVTYGQYGGSHIYAYIKSYFNGNLTASVRCRVIYVKTDYYNQNLIS